MGAPETHTLIGVPACDKLKWRDHGLRAHSRFAALRTSVHSLFGKASAFHDGDFGPRLHTDRWRQRRPNAVQPQFRLLAAAALGPMHGFIFQETATDVAVAQLHVTRASACFGPSSDDCLFNLPVTRPTASCAPGFGRWQNSALTGPVSLPVISSETTVERLNLRIDRAPPCPCEFGVPGIELHRQSRIDTPIPRFGRDASS